MTAVNALAANASGNAASALAALAGPDHGRAADIRGGLPPVDFASLLLAQTPAADEFAALRGVQAALDETADDEAPAADVGALLAEITQPLPPTTIPLAPIAVPAGRLTDAAPQAAPPDAAPATGAHLALPGAADDALSTDAGAGFRSPEREGRSAPEFKLPETTPLALSHALTTPTHVQGPTAAHAPAGQANLAVTPSIHSPKWSSEVGQGLVWMTRNEVQTAQLAINPPQLGPIEITLTLNKDQASAHFVSPHAEVREVLEQALPRLREILEGAGVQLGQADVSAQSQQQQFAGHSGRARDNAPAFGLEHATLPAQAAVNEARPAGVRMGNGLVDTFV